MRGPLHRVSYLPAAPVSADLVDKQSSVRQPRRSVALHDVKGKFVRRVDHRDAQVGGLGGCCGPW